MKISKKGKIFLRNRSNIIPQRKRINLVKNNDAAIMNLTGRIIKIKQELHHGDDSIEYRG